MNVWKGGEKHEVSLVFSNDKRNLNVSEMYLYFDNLRQFTNKIFFSISINELK